ncbi:unnamed protein product [Heligmosomoides polygyrus]|uniref:Uncharacterized protein n=1 Tax=Heligmosomoides polygyrus TaxID=6339 RepID=A0A183GRG1_HELPZ|nr:unnamed protein product [Heligmosomoides polygyrus]
MRRTRPTEAKSSPSPAPRAARDPNGEATSLVHEAGERTLPRIVRDNREAGYRFGTSSCLLQYSATSHSEISQRPPPPPTVPRPYDKGGSLRSADSKSITAKKAS